MPTSTAGWANTGGPLTRRIVDFTARFRLQEAPQAVADTAKLAVLDCLGVSILATSHDAGRAVATFADRFAAAGPCTVWGLDAKVSTRDAALLNGTLAHGLDYDDRNHSSTYSLATAFAAAEEAGCGGAKVLEAFIVAREVRNCLDALFAHRGSGVGPGARGWHSNGILGPIAATCAAARIHDDPPDIIVRAVGLAAGSCGALTRDGGTLAKAFRTGHAAATGLTCRMLAVSGLTSDDAAIEGERGLLDALGAIPDEIRASLGTSLGVDYDLARPLRGKQFASCTASHLGIEAMHRLRARQPFHSDDVAAIYCDLKPFPLLRKHPTTAMEARFSMPFCLAMAALGRALGVAEFSEASIADPEVAALMQRIRHRPGEETLRLELKSGDALVEPMIRPRNLGERTEIEAKFRHCVEPVLGFVKAGAIIDMVAGLERLSRIHELANQLTPR